MTTPLIAANVLSGPFTLAYTPPGGTSGTLGIIGPEGIRHNRNFAGEPITSDQYGRETILNGVYNGGNLFLEFLIQEANYLSCKALSFPFNQTTTSSSTTSLENELGTPGVLWSQGCGSLVLTSVAGTLAAAESTPTRTYGLCGLAMGHSLDYYLRAGLKSFPIRMQCLPYDIGSGKIGWFSKA